MRDVINALDAPLTVMSDMKLLRSQLERGMTLSPSAAKFVAEAIEDAEAIRAILARQEAA